MSNVQEEVSAFVSLLVATIKGDDAKVTAIKIQKKAKAFLKSQIAVKQAHTLSLEEHVEEAKEYLTRVRSNDGHLIEKGDSYISSLLSSNRTVKAKEEILKAHVDNISFLEDQLALVTK